MPAEIYNAIQYGYGVELTNNLFTTVGIGSDLTQIPKYDMHMSLSSLREYYTDILTTAEDQYSSLTRFVDYFTDVVNVMPGTADVGGESYGDYVLSQYDVFGEFPKSSDQAVIVVGSENDLTDLTLAQLGFIDEQDFLDLFLKAQDGTSSTMSIPFFDEENEDGTVTEGIIGREFVLYYNDAVYSPNQTGSSYHYVYGGYDLSTGVLRLKDGYTYGCLSEGLNLTEQLISEYMAVNMQSDVVRYLRENTGVNTSALVGYVSLYRYYTSGMMPGAEDWQSLYGSSATASGIETLIRALGGDNTPNSISVFARDFDTKERVLSYLDEWNRIAENARQAYLDAHGGSLEGYTGPTEVKYTDTVGLLMGMVQTILDAITYVLIAFTGISLVVSTVMIGVITYVSVVERTKEIGILRSLGARKKDIKRVFNAETFIIGLCAGLIGIGVAYLLQLLINAILTPLTGIAGLAALPIGGAGIMVLISVVLTLISGLVPASAAAKRDPVVALRSE